MPLPVPERGGSLDELKPFLNVDEGQFVLVKGWLLSALHCKGPYPILVLNGTEGSAKSTATRILRALIDPNEIPDSGVPRTVRDLNVTALYSHVLAFGNVSKLSPKISDALCRKSTGAGHVERTLNTNQDSARFAHIAQPIILNGIPDFVTAPDLLSRSIVLHLQFIKHNRTEADLWRDFRSKSGRIFGAILDHLVQGVRNLPSVQTANMRFSDSVKWCTACGLKDYEDHLRQHRINNNAMLLEDDEVVKGVKALMERQEQWEGTATGLTQELQKYGYQMPKNPRALSAHLRKNASAMRSALRIAVDFPTRTSDGRIVRISRSA